MTALPPPVRHLLFAACAVAQAACASAATTAGTGERVEIVVLGTTDLHGRLFPYDYYRGEVVDHGLARVATLVDSIRAARPHVVLLDSGDLLQGNPLDYYFGVVAPAAVHPVIAAMNWLGYDAAVVGNHEFNYGLPALERALDAAAFPFLAGNVFRAGTNRARWPAYRIVERAGVRIAVLGFTTPGAAVWDRRHLRGTLDFRDIVDAAQRAWPAAERESDVQIAIIHSGMGPGSSYDVTATGVAPENVGRALAEALSGLDLVLLGHTHRTVPADTVNGVVFAQAGRWGDGLAVATLVLERADRDWNLVGRETTVLPTAEVVPDPGFLAALRPAHDAVVAYVGDTIGWTPVEWSAADARLVDEPIIDLIQRVQLDATGAELSAASAFSTEARLGPGPITLADAGSLYNYENTLMSVRVTGRQLRAFLEHAARYFHQVTPDGGLVNAGSDTDIFVDSIPGYNYDMMAGVSYALDLTQPVGSRVQDLARNGRPVRDDETFTLALNSYRQGGGGGFAMLEDAPVVEDRQQGVRELIEQWIGARDTIRPADVAEPSWRLLPVGLVARYGAAGGHLAGTADSAGLAALAARETARIRGEATSRVETEPDLPSPLPATSDSVRLAVLATNDFHGALEALTPAWAGGDTIGGAATLAGYIRAIEARYPGATLHVNGGDVMQGTVISNLTSGRSTVDVLNAIGLDVAAIGNHEFDWGVDTLRARIAQARFPWLAANIFVKATGARPEWSEPYAWIERAGLRIAVIGAATTYTPVTTLPKNVAHLEFRDIATVVNDLAPRLKREGADIIILAVHSGAIADSAGGYHGEIVDAAEKITAPLDLIVSGHTHTRVNTVVNGIPIVQAASSGTALGIVTLTYDKGAGRVVDHTIQLVTTNAKGAPPDAEVAALVERYRAEVAVVANRPIAQLSETLERLRRDESALGGLIADAQRWATKTQIAFVNAGGIRTDLKAGAITYKDVFAVQPFQNNLIRLTLSGTQLKAALEGVVEDRLGQVSGIRFAFDPTRPRGDRVVRAKLEDGTAVVLGGRAVRPNARYTVTVNNFMAAGGDVYGVLGEAVETANTGLVDSDVLADYLAQLPQPIAYPNPQRIEQLAPWPAVGGE